jgi:hypothetical protein
MAIMINITAGSGTLPSRKIIARLLLELVVEVDAKVLEGITGPRFHWGT